MFDRMLISLDNFVYNSPIWLSSSVFVAAGISASGLMLLMTSRLVAEQTRHSHNEFTLFTVTNIAVLYAVLLAFVAIVAWEDLQAASAAVGKETSDIEALYLDAQGIKDKEVVSDLREQLRYYIETVTDREWPVQQTGHVPKAAEPGLHLIRMTLAAFTPQTPDDIALKQAMLLLLNDLLGAYYERREAAAGHIPDAVWWVIGFLGLLTTGFTAFLGMRNLWVHFLLLAGFTSTIIIVVILIAQLDYPFRGYIGISDELFEHALAQLGTLAPVTSEGDQKLKFALVPKTMDNPFFDLARDGCMQRAEELGNVECVYHGPIEHEPATQAQIIQDLITQRVDGLAISVADVGAVAGVIKAARAAGIPVITFDADAPGSAREAYIGSNNKDLGRALGEMMVRGHPRPGLYAMVSGGPAAANLNERIDGVREVAGKAGWQEVSGSPTYCNENLALAVQQLNDLTKAYPDLDAVVAVGDWPLLVPEGYRNFFNNNADRFRSGKLVVVSADTLPSEVQLLKGGYAAALVGQRPFEMGEKAMDALLALHAGKPVPQIIYTGVDRVTKDNLSELQQ
jgi:ribose transport system substrate-binding protein